MQRLRGLVATSVEAQELQKQIVNLLNPRMQGRRWGLLRSSGDLVVPSERGTTMSIAFVQEGTDTARNHNDFLSLLPHVAAHVCDYIQVVNPQLYIVRVLKDRTGCLEVGGEPWPNREAWRPLLEETGPRKTAWEFLLEEHD